MKTAVEWLLERLDIDLVDNGWYFEKAQALEMEKEQLIMFGAQCMVEIEKESGLGAIKIYELYFNKTFKSE
jgi:hypothetical protein